MPSFTAITHGREISVDLVAAPKLSTGRERTLGDVETLDATDRRTTERVGHSNPHLIVAAVGRLVSEQNEVVATVLVLEHANGVDDRFARSPSDPIRARR